jgi:hypothetical protein
MKKLLLITILLSSIFTLTSQADFFLCILNCFGSEKDDFMQGSNDDDEIIGGFGSDLIFGADGRDLVAGQQDDDILFGGMGSDMVLGEQGNDTIFPGPDDMYELQIAGGGIGNDTFYVFAGETVNCQFIVGDIDFDELFLIGFGPYSAEFPYGATGPIETGSNIIIQDPIAGGFLFVSISDNDSNMERIYGLTSPNVSILNTDETDEFSSMNCNRVI